MTASPEKTVDAALLARADELARALTGPGTGASPVADLFTAAHELVRTDAAQRSGVATRLVDSVLRPLAGSIAWTSAGDPFRSAPPAGESVSELLWGLACAATRLRAHPDAPAGLVEATATLQDLAAAGDPDKLAELRAVQAGLPAGIQSATDGPYLVTGVETMTNHLGEPLPTTPTMALCRCGASGRTPFCDGSHARIAFTGAKDPVTPSGGRQDEIIAAVRACPSGALSYAIDGREAREQVDHTSRPPAIEVSKDGPYLITGGPALTDGVGNPETRADGASPEHYALCRCGHSQNKPFCSGMHWYINFADPAPPEEPTLFQWAGGLPALLRMTRIFYGKYVPADPLLSPLFANMSPDHPERVAAWLGEVFGGPSSYSDTYGGYAQMISHHVGKCLTEDQRARWVALLSKSAAEAGLPTDAEFQAAFISYVEWGSRLALENSQTTAQPPANMPMPRWWWVCNATPGSRISALAPRSDDVQTVVRPGPGEQVGFAPHIKPLFRTQDRNSMRFAFDLWSYDDVVQHAGAILDQVRAGSMPCDGAWPTEWVETFARWIDNGKPG